MLPASSAGAPGLRARRRVMGPGWPTPYNIVVVSHNAADHGASAAGAGSTPTSARLARDPRVDSVVGPGAFVAQSQGPEGKLPEGPRGLRQAAQGRQEGPRPAREAASARPAPARAAAARASQRRRRRRQAAGAAPARPGRAPASCTPGSARRAAAPLKISGRPARARWPAPRALKKGAGRGARRLRAARGRARPGRQRRSRTGCRSSSSSPATSNASLDA